MRKSLLTYLLLTVAYVVSGKLGLMLALPPGYSSPIFPPAGIAVAAALIGGRRTLPWIFLGSLLLNVWIGYSASQQISTIGFTIAALIAISSMLQAFIGGWSLRRVIGYPVSLDHGGEVLRFLLLAPLVCLTSATLSVGSLLAFGMIDQVAFTANWASWWVGDTFGVVVMLPLVMIVAGEPRALWQSRTYTVALPMLLVFALFVAIFLKANQWEYNDSLTDFRQLSQQALNQVQNKLEEQESLLEQTAGIQIHDVKGHVTRDEFHRFVQKSLNRFSMIQALEWAPGVEGAHRASFEAAQRENFPDFEISERNAAGQLLRAEERSTYYPVTFVEPLAGNELAVGFDLASNSVRREALTKTMLSGVVVTTAPVHLVQERQHQEGVLLLLAVNSHDTQSGVVLTVLRMGDFMDKLLVDSRPMLFTRLLDLGEPNPLYDNFVSKNSHALMELTFDFGTRHYRLETAPTPAYLMQHHGWQSWSVLAVGILGTGLLGALLLLGTGYTARIEAQVEDRTRKLKEVDAKYRLVVDNVKEIIFMTDAKGLWTFLNRAWEEVTGFAVNESLGQLFLNYIHSEDRQRNLELFEPLIERKKDYCRHEIRYLTKDGGFRWIEVYARLALNEQNQIIGTYGTLMDISERKQAEVTLRESESRLRVMLENQIVGIVTTKDRVMLWTNPAYERMLGYDKGELVGMPTRQLYVSEESYQSFLTQAYPVISSGNIFRTQYEYLRKDGQRIWVDLSGTLLDMDSGESLWAFIDISEQVKAEVELKRSNIELEQFSYAISHDMRQPLRMISSYLQLIQKNLGEKFDQTNREFFKFAVDGAQRLDQMLVGLLEYSRVGRKSDPFEWMDSRDLLDEAILYLGPLIAEAQADLRIDGEWPRVSVSRDEIMRLMQNLIGNAVKYRVAGRIPQIHIASKITGNKWQVSVSDNGIGIDPNQVGRLFQVFQRLQSHASYEGNGIGLALSRRIVEHHGGRIWAESTGENQGSTFSFELSQEHKA